MATHLSIIHTIDGDKLLLVQADINLNSEGQVSNFIKSIRELVAKNKTTPITEADLVPPSEPVTTTDQKIITP